MTRSEQLTEWVEEQYRGHLYFDHCLAVAQLAAPAAPLAYEVGLCHDMLEDHIATEETLRHKLDELGYNATEIHQILAAVLELTDVFTKEAFPDLNKKERRKQENARLSRTEPLAQTVKYADVIDGVRWIKENRPEKLSRYLRRKRKLLSVLNQGHSGLRRQTLKILREPAES